MSKPTTIDINELVNVNGGQDVSASGSVKTPAGVEASGSLTSTGTPERKLDFNTCMNDRESGWSLESRQTRQDRALAACKGLKGSPTNPQ